MPEKPFPKRERFFNVSIIPGIYPRASDFPYVILKLLSCPIVVNSDIISNFAS